MLSQIFHEIEEKTISTISDTVCILIMFLVKQKRLNQPVTAYHLPAVFQKLGYDLLEHLRRRPEKSSGGWIVRVWFVQLTKSSC